MLLEEEQILGLADFNLNKVPKVFHKYLLFDKDALQERWDACAKCEFLTEKLKCQKCGCFMRIKSRVAKMKCPIGKWDRA